MKQDTTATLVDKLTSIDEEVTKNYPDLLYSGVIQSYEDEMDYVNVAPKGVRIA